jgi:hypothetical protein
MDNFIQYLFYFIIIAAFLNSIFGKKKKAEAKRIPQENESESFGTDTIDTKTHTSESNREDFAILKEIENLFKKDMPAEQRYPMKKEKGKEEMVDVNKDYIEERAKEFEKHDFKRKDNYDWFSINIRNKLRNPESLKDYIIISEILGKPKAFE